MTGWQWLAGGGCHQCLPHRVARLATAQAAIKEKRKAAASKGRKK